MLARFGKVEGTRFAMLGLAFKPETDDMGGTFHSISHRLTELGAKVAYDPVVGKREKGDWR